MNTVTCLAPDKRTRLDIGGEAMRILVLSKCSDFVTIENLSLDTFRSAREFHLITTDKISEAITLIEENYFDLICIDYAAVGINTLTLLEYTTKTSDLNSHATKIVLTESFSHISSRHREDVLCFANKVISKSADYFSMTKIIANSCFEVGNVYR